MFSKPLEVLIGGVYKSCRESRETAMTVEHLLFALATSEDMKPTWEGLNAKLVPLKKGLSRYLEKEVQRLPPDEFTDTQPTLGFQRVLQRAVYHAQASGKREVTPQGVLIALFGEKDSKAVELLEAQGISRLDAVALINQGTKRSQKSQEEQIEQRVSEFIIQELDTAPGTVATKRPRIFISYSHADDDALRRLMVHLRPLERDNIIDCWSDKKIQAGDQWKAEISKRLGNADVAILLISADFLASDFIATDELPPLLLKAEEKGVRILPVILKPCGFIRNKVLSSFQCINDPREPLLGLTHIGQEAIYDKIVEEVHREINVLKVESGL